MIPYIIFILVIVFLYFRKAPVWMLAVMILFSVLRYDTGWDYNMYEETVLHPSRWSNPEKSHFSWLWCQLFAFAYEIKFPHLAIALPNFVTYLVIYLSLKLLKLDKEQKCQALIVYICWQSFYLDSFSIIRQEIAMSFGFLAFALLQRKQFVWSVITVLLAAQLHTSAYVLVILYPVYLFRKVLNFNTICVASVIVAALLVSASNVLEALTIVDMSKYEVYLKSKDSFGDKITYVYILLAVYLLVMYHLSRKWTDVEKQCFMLSIVSMIGCVAVFTVGVSSVFTRIFSYFIIFMIVVFLPSMRILKARKLLSSAAVVLLAAYFLVYLEVTSAGVKLASSGMVPYKCILFQ